MWILSQVLKPLWILLHSDLISLITFLFMVIIVIFKHMIVLTILCIWIFTLFFLFYICFTSIITTLIISFVNYTNFIFTFEIFIYLTNMILKLEKVYLCGSPYQFFLWYIALHLFHIFQLRYVLNCFSHFRNFVLY